MQHIHPSTPQRTNGSTHPPHLALSIRHCVLPNTPDAMSAGIREPMTVSTDDVM